jgi:hypothetical protein
VNLGRENVRRLCANALAPAKEIRRVVFAEMREGVEPLFRRVRIQNDLDETQEAIVFNDEFHDIKKPVQASNVQSSRSDSVSDVEP